jgi:hypothetical protein
MSLEHIDQRATVSEDEEFWAIRDGITKLGWIPTHEGRDGRRNRPSRTFERASYNLIDTDTERVCTGANDKEILRAFLRELEEARATT